MAATLTVPTIFTAVDRLTSVVDRMSKAVSSFGIKAQKAMSIGNGWFNKLTPTLSSASKQLLNFVSTAAIASQILAGITFGGKSIIDYEVALHSLQAVTGTSYKLFQGQIESIADKSKKSAIDVAGSFEEIGSAMSQYLQSPKELGMIAQSGIILAKASRQELIPTLKDLTSIMNQFKLEAKDSNAVINRLTAGEIVGNMRTSEVATALQEFGAGAKLANVNLGESVALVEVLGRQMQHATVGNAAKNIMIILDSAKGLAKRARKELTKNGVNMDVLMSHTVPLGVRLKELSKILNDSVAMTKVFGRENKTAGQVILSNLKTYEDWEKQIQKTNKASEQAAINSDTIANRWTELKNSFSNAIITGDKLDDKLGDIKSALGFVGDNMTTILSVGTKILLFFGAWKLLLWTVGSAVYAFNIAIGIQTALIGAQAGVLEGNAVAIASYTVVTRLATAATWLWSGAVWAVNAALAANPVVALVALATAIAMVIKNWDKWGSTAAIAFSPILSVIQSFRRNWEMIGNSFSKGGFLEGIHAIGTAINDGLLQPLEMVLAALGKLTGADWAIQASNQIHIMRATSNAVLDNTKDEDLPVLPPSHIVVQQQAQDKAARQNQSHWLGIDIIDPNGLVGGTTQTGPRPIPVKVTSTKGVR